MPSKPKKKQPSPKLKDRTEAAIAALTHCPQTGHRLKTTWSDEGDKVTRIYCPACSFEIKARKPTAPTPPRTQKTPNKQYETGDLDPA